MVMLDLCLPLRTTISELAIYFDESQVPKLQFPLWTTQIETHLIKWDDIYSI